jgi:hypothetical protein
VINEPAIEERRRALKVWSRWVILALALSASVASLMITRDGVGIDGDSAAYLGTAENLAEGHGATVPFTLYTDDYSPRESADLVGHVPLTHFPPGYPLLLAVVGSAGIDTGQAARALGAVLLGLNVVLVGLLAEQLLTGTALRVLVVLLALCGPVGADPFFDRTWLFEHSQAMSEGLFTTFVLLTLLALMRYQRQPDIRAALIVAAAAGASVTVRYSGVAVVATAFMVVTASTVGPTVRRLGRATLVAVTACAPICLYEAAVLMGSHARSVRSLHSSAFRFSPLATVFEGYLGLEHWPVVLRHAAFATAVVGIVAAARQSRRPALLPLGAMIALFSTSIVMTNAIFDASTRFDDRIFSPIQGVFYLFVAGAVASGGGQLLKDRPIIGRVGPLVGLAVPMGLVLSAIPSAASLVGNGAERSQAARTVMAAAELPAGSMIATNVPTQIWENTGRGSFIVPRRTNAVTGSPNDRFEAEIRELVVVVREHGGYIVLINGATGGFGVADQANEQDLHGFGLRVVHREADGVILGTD